MIDLHKELETIGVTQKHIELGHTLGDWFIFREKRHFGPLTTKQINHFLLNRLISTNHHIWRPGQQQWVKISDVECFKACGQPEIDFISDNEFSFRAELGPIDRIRFQETEISFKDNNEVSLLQINVSSDIKQKLNIIKTSANGIYEDLLLNLGVATEHKKYWDIGLISFGAVFAILVLFLIFSGPNEEFFVNKLPKEMREKLIANAELAETTITPSIVFLEKSTDLKDPVFVGSVNLPLGSKIEIEITGDAKTLLGSYRFSKLIEVTLNSHYFQTEAIRGSMGQYLSPGKYMAVVRCLSCQKENVILTDYNFTYGISNQELYKKDLKAFHIRARESAKLELDELLDLSETLLGQYQNTVNIYNRTINSKKSSTWNQFSTGWLSTQKKMVELFEQIQSEEFKSKLYYLSLYEAYGEVTRMIFELHVLQDKYVAGVESGHNLAVKIAEDSQTVKLKLAYLKSQVDLMMVNYNRSSGLPPKEGLSLEAFSSKN